MLESVGLYVWLGLAALTAGAVNSIAGGGTLLDNGIHILDLPTASLPVGAQVIFTLYWKDESRWEGTDFRVIVE